MAFAGLGWLVAPAILILFSLWKPVLQPKLLIWILVPFLTSCAAGLALLPWSFVRVVLLAALVAWNLQGVAREWEVIRLDFRAAYQTFSKEASSDATVIICPPRFLDVSRYYLKQEGREDASLHTWNHREDRPKVVSVTAGGDPGGHIGPPELFVKYREIWLMAGSICWKRLDSLKKALEEEGRFTKQWRFRGGHPLGLWLYERRE